MKQRNYTEAGTDIDEVKKLNAASGLSYNEVKALLVKGYKAQATDISTAKLNESSKDFNGSK